MPNSRHHNEFRSRAGDSPYKIYLQFPCLVSQFSKLDAGAGTVSTPPLPAPAASLTSNSTRTELSAISQIMRACQNGRRDGPGIMYSFCIGTSFPNQQDFNFGCLDLYMIIFPAFLNLANLEVLRTILQLSARRNELKTRWGSAVSRL